MDDILKHQLETEAWIKDLDHFGFGMPPPQKHIRESSGELLNYNDDYINQNSSKIVPQTSQMWLPSNPMPYSEHQSNQAYHHGYQSSSSDSQYFSGGSSSANYPTNANTVYSSAFANIGADEEEFRNNTDFLEKLRKFQLSANHPYANKSRVETTKKIATEGRASARDLNSLNSPTISLVEKSQKQSTKVGKLPLSAYPLGLLERERAGKSPLSPESGIKERISKEEIGALTRNVRDAVRPLNVSIQEQREAAILPIPSPADLKLFKSPEIYNRQLEIATENSDNLQVPASNSSAYSSLSGGDSSGSGVENSQRGGGNSGVDKIPLPPPPPPSTLGGIMQKQSEKSFAQSQIQDFRPPDLQRLNNLSIGAKRGTRQGLFENSVSNKVENNPIANQCREEIVIIPASHNSKLAATKNNTGETSNDLQKSSFEQRHKTWLPNSPMHNNQSMTHQTNSSYSSYSPTFQDGSGQTQILDLIMGRNSALSPAALQSLARQQQNYEKMRDDVERRLEKEHERQILGVCVHCHLPVTGTEGTDAMGRLYHVNCFTCHCCGRFLTDKRFYDVDGKIYCEEDYKYGGFQQSVEKCDSCGQVILDMIIQAAGRSFHPKCFRCSHCKRCLDGAQFTKDDQERIYCIDDYRVLFAPRCTSCGQPILPIEGSEQTVRVLCMGKDYHVECYVCEGCHIQLTDEPSKGCFPLGEHLLCQRCNLHWRRIGDGDQPITDL